MKNIDAARLLPKWRAQNLGQMGEEFALSLYRRAQFEIVEQDARIDNVQIDFIARRAGRLHFVEVKTRATIMLASNALKPAQIARIARAARSYAHFQPEYVQIDAMLIDRQFAWKRIDNILINLPVDESAEDRWSR